MARGFVIFVASLTARKHNRIFLLCHYFATEISGNNSNPSTTEKMNSCAKFTGKIPVHSLRYGHGRDTRQIRPTRNKPLVKWNQD